MHSRHSTRRDDASRPPLFSTEEWQGVVTSFGLSPKQAQVVGWVMQSKRNKEIARLLKISERTVREHIDAARRRLNAVDRMALFYRVIERLLSGTGRRHRRK